MPERYPDDIGSQMTPPAQGLAARLAIGPALRAQPDRRLVALVREGYETAFEEIVRRYGSLLRRYAARIVGERAEDVTQDALSKALLALRRDGAEIELRPWLLRIVRNTALNDLRDSPPPAEELAEALVAGGLSAAEETERREELAELIRGLRALPEAQRAAIVMRELEGLGHEEIAVALGVSGSGARQAIHRARVALRDGLGMLLPLPLLRAVMDASGTHVEVGAAGAAGLGGAGVALKAATATVLVAGAVGAGVAIDHGRHDGDRASASPVEALASSSPAGAASASPIAAESEDSPGSDERQDGGHNRGGNNDSGGPEGRSGHDGRNRGGREDPATPGESGEDVRGPDSEYGVRGGPSGQEGSDDRSGGPDSGSPDSEQNHSGQEGRSSEDDGSGESSGPEGSRPQPPDEGVETDEPGASNSGPGSDGHDGTEEASSGSSGDSHGGDGFSLQTDPKVEED